MLSGIKDKPNIFLLCLDLSTLLPNPAEKRTASSGLSDFFIVANKISGDGHRCQTLLFGVVAVTANLESRFALTDYLTKW
jgi:hypothetical protein